MTVELGAPIVLVEGVESLWHIAGELEHTLRSPTLCGLSGAVYAYRGPNRTRRLCAVCRERNRGADLVDPTLGPLPRSGGAPKWSTAKLTEPQVRALHRAYLEQRLSCNELARRIDWHSLGFASLHSAANGIWAGFRRLGLETRSQSQSTTLRNLRHGRCTRERRAAGGDHGHEGYRAWLRHEQGRARPRCAGLKTQSPGRGRPCSRPAMEGSEFCYSHDPRRHAEVEAQLAAMRAVREEIAA